LKWILVLNVWAEQDAEENIWIYERGTGKEWRKLHDKEIRSVTKKPEGKRSLDGDVGIDG
jgi:hypothetical protein